MTNLDNVEKKPLSFSFQKIYVFLKLSISESQMETYFEPIVFSGALKTNEDLRKSKKKFLMFRR